MHTASFGGLRVVGPAHLRSPTPYCKKHGHVCLQKKIKEFEPVIKQVLAEESEEAELAQADMRVRKAQNMIDHEAEIFSRAPRQWIMDEAHRKDVKGAPAAESVAGDSLLTVIWLAEASKKAHHGEAGGPGPAVLAKLPPKERAKRKRNEDIDRAVFFFFFFFFQPVGYIGPDSPRVARSGHGGGDPRGEARQEAQENLRG